jgi:hypothetical protein
MKKMMIMLAVATLPATAGCNCCGVGACPCNPCNWFNRGAYCGPTTYAAPTCPPTTCPPTFTPAVMQQAVPQQYVMPSTAPYATPYTAAPMMTAPAQMQMPYAYSDPGCGYMAAEASCGYMGAVGYGPSIPMEMGAPCCETGAYDAGAAPATGETFIDPTPQAE